mmetsp:Transcript_20352/g.47116  ORF Transcript_20352/g.47116 Transcript_20352/m.47116 type:complete len:179 (-) Transcript_20352:509-1045(-)
MSESTPLRYCSHLLPRSPTHPTETSGKVQSQCNEWLEPNMIDQEAIISQFLGQLMKYGGGCHSPGQTSIAEQESVANEETIRKVMEEIPQHQRGCQSVVKALFCFCFINQKWDTDAANQQSPESGMNAQNQDGKQHKKTHQFPSRLPHCLAPHSFQLLLERLGCWSCLRSHRVLRDCG